MKKLDKTTAIMFVIMLMAMSACMPNYSEGKWNGVVVKLSHKGMIWKSWEGQIVLGGMRSKTTAHYSAKGEYAGSSTSAVTNAYDFNVGSPEILRKVQEAMDQGKVVELSYRQWCIAPPWIENDHVVIEVKELE
jgi:hypothetical protein